MLVALALLGLSLPHLASGVAIVTGSGERDGWLIWASSPWNWPSTGCEFFGLLKFVPRPLINRFFLSLLLRSS